MTLTIPVIAPRLRRVTSADGLDPAGPPPGVAWFGRETHRVGEGQFRLTVPCVLEVAVSDGVHAGLTSELKRRWVDARHRSRPWRIVGVVAAFHASAGRSAELTLAITTTGADTLDAFEDAPLRADLEGVLASTCLTVPRTETPQVRP